MCAAAAQGAGGGEPAQIFDAGALRINGDPFEALICAAARDLELPLLTRDADIRKSGAVTDDVVITAPGRTSRGNCGAAPPRA